MISRILLINARGQKIAEGQCPLRQAPATVVHGGVVYRLHMTKKNAGVYSACALASLRISEAM